MVDDPSRLPQSSIVRTVPSPETGYLEQIHAREIGFSAMELGAGRAKKGDPIDYAVGIVLKCKVGDWVEKGEPLFDIHTNDKDRCDSVAKRVGAAHRFSKSIVSPLPNFYQTVMGGEEEKKQ